MNKVDPKNPATWIVGSLIRRTTCDYQGLIVGNVYKFHGHHNGDLWVEGIVEKCNASRFELLSPPELKSHGSRKFSELNKTEQLALVTALYNDNLEVQTLSIGENWVKSNNFHGKGIVFNPNLSYRAVNLNEQTLKDLMSDLQKAEHKLDSCEQELQDARDAVAELKIEIETIKEKLEN